MCFQAALARNKNSIICLFYVTALMGLWLLLFVITRKVKKIILIAVLFPEGVNPWNPAQLVILIPVRRIKRDAVFLTPH